MLTISQIHVDKYMLQLYKSLVGPEKTAIAHEGPVLAGYILGNNPKDGCLTSNSSVRVHSCEKGMKCPAITDKTVWINPIIARTRNGDELAEVGVGGGGNDLIKLELKFGREGIDKVLSL